MCIIQNIMKHYGLENYESDAHVMSVKRGVSSL